MEQKTDRLYPSAPFEKKDSDKRLENKLNDIKGFNTSIDNIEEKISYFKDENNKSIKNIKNTN